MVLAYKLDTSVRDDRSHCQRQNPLPGERVGRGARRRLELLVVELDPERARSAASSARGAAVLFLTNRSRWPASRKRPTAAAPPAIGSP